MTLPPEVPDFAAVLAEDLRVGETWEQLRARVASEGNTRYAHITEDDLTKVQEQLPDALQKVLIDYSDARGEQEYITLQAAYEVGVAVGRRLGGAR